MASAKREPLMGVWGLCKAPGWGVRMAKPPGAERIYIING